MALVDVPFSELHAKYGDSDDDTPAVAAQGVLGTQVLPCITSADAGCQNFPSTENESLQQEDEDISYHQQEHLGQNYWDVLSGDDLDSAFKAEEGASKGHLDTKRDDDCDSHYPLEEDEYNYWDVLSGDELEAEFKAEREAHAGKQHRQTVHCLQTCPSARAQAPSHHLVVALADVRVLARGGTADVLPGGHQGPNAQGGRVTKKVVWKNNNTGEKR